MNGWMNEYKENTKMFYIAKHSTHFIYGVGPMVKDYLDSKKENLLPPFQERERDFKCTISQDSTHHDLCYNCYGALAGARNTSMSLP